MNMAWDLGAVDGAWELCGLLNYGCWIWCLCYILQWDRRRGASEGQSHSPGIWNGGTEICRNISDEKILSSPGSRYSGIYVSSIFCCGVSGHLMSRMVTESQDVGGTGNCPGPWRPTVHSVRARHARGGNIRPVLAVSSEIWRNERNESLFSPPHKYVVLPPPIVALIMWLNDCDPKPGTHHVGVWPLSCLCPVWSAVCTADDGSAHYWFCCLC